MQAFAVVRAHDVLVQACEDISTCLSLRNARRPGTEDFEQMLGIWLPRECRMQKFATLYRRYLHDVGKSLDAAASAGVSDLWTLFWMDGSAGCSGGRGLSRAGLVAKLIDVHACCTNGSCEGRFMPVFPDSSVRSAVRREMASLHDAYPAHIGSPVVQDSATGCLRTLPMTDR